MIAAMSSASFIQDEELAHYVALIGQANAPQPMVDLFSTVPRKVH
jgi:hypothetical protein